MKCEALSRPNLRLWKVNNKLQRHRQFDNLALYKHNAHRRSTLNILLELTERVENRRT